MGNQSVFSTLGDHADHMGFWGEIFDSDDVAGRTASDMGSGYFPNSGWTWSGYMHNLLAQTDRGGGLSNYDGSVEIYESDPDMLQNARGTLTAARPGGATYTSGDQGPAKEGLPSALTKCWEIIADNLSSLELGLCLSDRFQRTNDLDLPTPIAATESRATTPNDQRFSREGADVAPVTS